MAKRMLTRSEVIKAHGLFTQHLVPSDREGFFKYQEGWDDAKIAQELDPTIQANAIGNLRTELFGKLDTVKNLTADGNNRVKELETVVQNLLTYYGELEVKFNKLVETLALNKVVNVAHLKTTCKDNPVAKAS